MTGGVSEHLSGVDDAQLERWAYGRATTPEEQERATRASDELQRRATLDRERAERAAAEHAAAAAHALAVTNGEVDDPASEHPESPHRDDERRHRRRMLATGIAGVTVAALALVGGVIVLSQPDPDPLAIFERPDTDQDRDWAVRLASTFGGTFTAGPRAIELGDGYVAFVARVSTVSDGRSTVWDSYCLYVSDGGTEKGPWSLTATCTYPEKFEREGIVYAHRPSATSDGVDTVTWGPTAGPRLERNAPLIDDDRASASVLDWLVYPSTLEPDFFAAGTVDEPSQLLMGPAVVAVFTSSDDVDALLDADLVVSTHLLRGDAATTGTRLCVHVSVGDRSEATRCAALTAVRRDGIDVPLTAEGRSWLVSIGADGPGRRDYVRLLD